MANTHNLRIEFGKHKGKRWTRLPVSYLRWLANETSGRKKALAISELERRNTVIKPELELSSHAINRASQITSEWKDVGVYSWLQKIAEAALKEADGKESVVYRGYKFAFAYGNYYPVLKTIIKKGGNNGIKK